MPDLEAEAKRAVGWFEHHVPHHHAAPQTPAQQPDSPAAAPAAATAPQEDTMPSKFITDVEEGYAAIKTEVGKLETTLPSALAKAKQLEDNPLADLALKAAEAVADSVLPAEAVAAVARAAGKIYDEIAGLYAPQQPATAVADQPQQPSVPLA